MKPTNSLLITTTAWCALYSSAFAAGPIPYKFTGTVTSVAAALSSQFSPGEIISGTMSLTPTIVEFDRGGAAISNFSANIGGDYPITISEGGLVVLNDFGGVIDLVGLDSRPVAAPVAGHVAEYFNFNLLYDGTTHLTSVNLLPQFIFANPLDRSNLRFDGNDSLTVQFHLSDFSQVPEPGAAFLAIIAATIFAAAGRPSFVAANRRRTASVAVG